MSKNVEISVQPDGDFEMLYDAEHMPIAKAVGDCDTRRASHVEASADLWDDVLARLRDQDALQGETPEELRRDLLQRFPDKWWAEMAPSNGPVLGPFDTRDEALREEVAWLQKNRLHNV